MVAILNYSDVYGLCEELQKLSGAPMQNVWSATEDRIHLDFRLPGLTRTLVLDLTPSQPFFLSTTSTPPKGKKQNTPAINFLRAHFVGLKLQKVEVAQKPNRTLRLLFGVTEAAPTLTFHCYPHGQALILVAGGKRVITPKKPFPEEEAFVEPELMDGWELNEKQASFRLPQNASSSSPSPSASSAASSSASIDKPDPRIAKLEKAILQIDEGSEKSEKKNKERIAELEQQALVLRSAKKVDGLELDNLYDQIKKIKRKFLAQQTRRNELLEQLEKVKRGEGPRRPAAPSGGAQKKVFAGTRIVIDDSWELWVGRNAAQNDELIKVCSPHDWWIHLRDYPGAHGVLRGPKKSEPPAAHVDFACCVVAQFSQSKKNPFAEGDKLDFILAPLKFVKKPKGAAPGRVIVEREKVRRVAFKMTKFQVS